MRDQNNLYITKHSEFDRNATKTAALSSPNEKHINIRSISMKKNKNGSNLDKKLCYV